MCDTGLVPILTSSVVKLYVGGKLPVTYRPLLARLGHLALVLKGVGQSIRTKYLSSNFTITQLTFLRYECLQLWCVIIRVDLYSVFLQETSNALNVLVCGKRKVLNPVYAIQPVVKPVVQPV